MKLHANGPTVLAQAAAAPYAKERPGPWEGMRTASLPPTLPHAIRSNVSALAVHLNGSALRSALTAARVPLPQKASTLLPDVDKMNESVAKQASPCNPYTTLTPPHPFPTPP